MTEPKVVASRYANSVDRRRLWQAAIKWPMYAVAVMPVLLAAGWRLGQALPVRFDQLLLFLLAAVLLLVETIAAGTEGTPITRHLVRNMLQIPWPVRDAAGHQEPPNLLERRPLSVPSSAQAQRLRVVGWLQNREGRLLAAAQSACLPELEDTASTPP